MQQQEMQQYLLPWFIFPSFYNNSRFDLIYFFEIQKWIESLEYEVQSIGSIGLTESNEIHELNQ